MDRPSLRICAGLALILLLGFGVRAQETRFGLPYLHHFDEPAIGNRALRILQTGDWNPHFFHYPSLLLYLDAGVDVLVYFHLVALPPTEPESLDSLTDIRTGGEDDPWFVSHPSFYRWNRTLTALFGTVAVALVFFLTRRLGRELMGRPGAAPRSETTSWATGADLAGLLAALTLASLPFHIVHSAFLTTDVPASTLALGAVFLSVRFVQDRRARDLAGAALLVGLAASTKYNLASALAVPAVALLGSRLRAAPVNRERARQGWLWAALLVLPAVGFLAGTPWAVLDLPTFLNDAGNEVRHYLVLGHGSVTVEPGWPHLRAELGTLTHNATWPIALLALVGAGTALRRWTGWVALLLPVLQLVLTARTSVLFHRNLMIVYPFVALAFGLGAVALARGGVRWLGRFRPRHVRWTAALYWVAVAVLLGWRTEHALAHAQATGSTAETRSRAVDRVDRLAPRQDAPFALRVARELEVHPLDLERLSVPYEVRPLAEIACRPEPGTLALVPQRLETWIPRFEPRVETLNALLDHRGEELFSIAGRTTVLTHFSTDPAVVLRRPWAWSEDQVPPLVCAHPPLSVPHPVGPLAHTAGEAAVLTVGGSAESRFFAAPEGRLVATWNDAGPGLGPRLRARVVRRPLPSANEGEEEEVVAEEVYDPHPRGVRRRLVFTLDRPAEVAIRFRAADAKEGVQNGRIRVRRVWLVPVPSGG